MKVVRVGILCWCGCDVDDGVVEVGFVDVMCGCGLDKICGCGVVWYENYVDEICGQSV